MQSLLKYLYIKIKITPTQNGRSRNIFINEEYKILYRPLVETYWNFFLKKGEFQNISNEQWENFNLDDLLSRIIIKIISDYNKNYSADYNKNYSVYNNSYYKNRFIFKEDKSSLGASQPEINSSTSIKPIKPLLEEFQSKIKRSLRNVKKFLITSATWKTIYKPNLEPKNPKKHL